MKRLIAAMIIALSMISLAAWLLYDLKNTKDELLGSLDLVYEAANTEDYERAAQLTDQFLERWNAEEDRLMMFVAHTHVDNVSTAASRLAALIKYRDIPDYMSQLRQVYQAIEHLWRAEAPSFDNML